MRPSSVVIALAFAVAPIHAAAQAGVPAAAVPERAQAAAPEMPTLAELQWVARPLVIFADTPEDPRFVQQLAMLEERRAELEERDVVVLTDTDPGALGPLREELRPRGFGVVLIDKDGTVAQRRPAPTSAREIVNLIDRMPSRRQETGSMRN